MVSASEEAQQAAVAACLRKIKPGHFQNKRLAFELRDVGFTPTASLSTLHSLVNGIYTLATSDPGRYAEPCAALCASLVPLLPTFKPPDRVETADQHGWKQSMRRIDFRQTLLNTCQTQFQATAAVGSQTPASEVDGTSQPTAGGDGDQLQAVAGCLQFLGHLYLQGLLTARIMAACISAAAAAAVADSAEQRGGSMVARVEGLTRTLLVVGHAVRCVRRVGCRRAPCATANAAAHPAT